MSVGEQKAPEETKVEPPVDNRPEWDVSLPANPIKRVRGNDASDAVASYKKIMGIVSSEHKFMVSGPIGSPNQSSEDGSIGDQIEVVPPAADKLPKEDTPVPSENPLLSQGEKNNSGRRPRS